MPDSTLYLVPAERGHCSFCGSSGVPVAASEKVEEEAPPGICEDCALDALSLIEAGDSA